MTKKYPKNLVLSDPHLPYTNMRYWEQAHEFARRFKPDRVFSSGDFADQYVLSRFPKATRADNGRMEILKCIPQINRIKRWFPEMQIMKGNHDDRINKRAQDAGIDGLWINDFLDIVGAPKGWKWCPEDWIDIGPAILTHGFLGNRQAHASWFNRSVIHGHLHAKLGIEFFQRNAKEVWVMCVGAMADRKALPLQYGPLKKFSTMTPGLGYTDEYGDPHVLHFKG